MEEIELVDNLLPEIDQNRVEVVGGSEDDSWLPLQYLC